MSQTPIARNARAEADLHAPPGYEARVLEPSPPAVHDGKWFADDPTDGADATSAVVSPVSSADMTWDEHARESPAVGEFAAVRWLGNHRRLESLPPDFAAQRADLHRVAFHVISEAREQANGKIALRYTHRGFGTPFFGDDRQVRVEGTDLVVQDGESVRSHGAHHARRGGGFRGCDL